MINERIPVVAIENLSQAEFEIRFMEAQTKNTFYVAKFVTSSSQKSFVSVLLITVLLLPFAYFSLHYNHSDTILLTLPQNCLRTHAFYVLE